jgi:hypothetical protein
MLQIQHRQLQQANCLLQLRRHGQLLTEPELNRLLHLEFESGTLFECF